MPYGQHMVFAGHRLPAIFSPTGKIILPQNRIGRLIEAVWQLRPYQNPVIGGIGHRQSIPLQRHRIMENGASRGPVRHTAIQKPTENRADRLKYRPAGRKAGCSTPICDGCRHRRYKSSRLYRQYHVASGSCWPQPRSPDFPSRGSAHLDPK